MFKEQANQTQSYESRTFNSPLTSVTLFIFSWAFQIFISKLGFIAGARVFTFTFQSYLFAFIFLSILILSKKWREIKRIPFQVLFWVLLADAIHVGIGSLLSQIGVQLTSAINAGFLMQFTTVSTTTLAWIFLKEKMNISKIVTILMVLVGTFLLATEGHGLSRFEIGDMLILLACVCWSTSSILVRKTLKNTSATPSVISFFRPVTGIPVLICFLLLAPLYPPSVRTTFQLNLLDFHLVLYSILNGFLSASTWLFFSRTLKVASASYMTIMNSATPVVVALLAFFFLKETVDAIQLLGMAFIFSSTLLTQYLKVEKH